MPKPKEKPAASQPAETRKLEDIRIRDPFVLPDKRAGLYYLYANMSNRRRGARGWECYTSRDLKRWSAPTGVFKPPKGFWGKRDFWAPEVHRYKGKYYLFGTLSAARAKRGTQIFAADRPSGPFRPHSDRAATPHDWMALDGTLYVEDGRPWMVFCHEWVQIGDGTMEAVRLSDGLRRPAGKPVTLFRASQAPWVRPVQKGKYVTDGPCLHKVASGELLMLWSSFSATGYAVGVVRSASGKVRGPWKHDPKPLFADDGGHCMLFRAFDGSLMLALHAPNRNGRERARLFHVEEAAGRLRLKPAK